MQNKNTIKSILLLISFFLITSCSNNRAMKLLGINMTNKM